MVLRQEKLIAAVRARCESDPDVEAALMYGSFAQGLGDAYSDVEFWLFFGVPVDPFKWLSSVAAYEYVVVNEFGTHVVFFPGLIRGELHFATTGDIETVRSWPARPAPL